ncbi:MAG: hypothetical protein Q9210_004993, partial [Variospora velana]
MHQYNHDYPGTNGSGPSHDKSLSSRQDLSWTRQVYQSGFDQNQNDRDGYSRYGHRHGAECEKINVHDSPPQFPLTSPHRQPQGFRRGSPLPHTLDQEEVNVARQNRHETESSMRDHDYMGATAPTQARYGLRDPNKRTREYGTQGHGRLGQSPNVINKQQSSWSPQDRRVVNPDYAVNYGERPPKLTRQIGNQNPIANQPTKATKERFLTSPSSPEYLGWDNPFPTFPSSKKKHKHPAIEGLNNSVHDVKLDQRSYAELPEESRLSEGDGNSRHNFLRNGGSSVLQEGASTKTNPRTAHSPYASQQDTNQILHGAGGSSQLIQRSRDQPTQPSSHLGPQMEYSRHSAGTPHDPSFPRPAPPRSNNQRSEAMPAALTDALTSPGSRGNYGQRAIAQDDRQNPLVPRDWPHLESPLHHQSSRPPLQPHSRSADTLPHGGRMSHEPQTLHPQSIHSQQASIGEVFDSYYHSPPHSRSSLGHADSQRTFSDEAMPKFGPIAGAGISRAPREEKQPSAVTHEGLERLRQASKSNPSDRQTQLLLAKKLVEAASVLADEGGRADSKTTSRNCERFTSEAYKILKRLAQHGYPDAMFFLGDCYSRGSLGLQIDAKEAFAQYQSAAKAEHAQAAYRVAVCCEIGLDEGGGTKRDAVKAMQWYQRAATLGDTPAMYKLGIIQLKGLLGQPRNAKAALKWLQQAAAHGDKENPHALHELVSDGYLRMKRPFRLMQPGMQASLYEAPDSIEGISQDNAHAKQLFLEAANLGYKFSQFRLGCAFEYGLLGCPIDPRQSIAWYSKAAVQDEHQSELALSGWYLTGSEGVLQQSDTEAYLWARKAAQAGLAKAEYAMGYFIEVGIGTPANIEDAKRWYWRSA